MPVSEWERTFTCPYNPAHQITVEKIQFHLVKCRRNHPGSGLEICPFNTSHHLPRAEMQFHLSVCSDRRMVEQERYGAAPRAAIGSTSAPAPRLPPSTEDWEEEATVRRSYDPSARAASMPVLRKLEGATPSQRREFRAQERQRWEAVSQDSGRELEGGLRRPQLGEAAGTGPVLLRRPGSLLASSGLRSSLGSTRSSLDRAILAAGAGSARPPLRRPTLTPPAAVINNRL